MPRNFDLGLFRAEKEVEQRRLDWKPTTRWPVNVPFLVDNLWEWRRSRQFDGYPTRRHALFAYSRRELAQQYVDEHPKDDLAVYRVILHDRFTLCQVPGLRDSKHHTDCKELRQETFRILAEHGLVEDKGWSACATLDDKQTVGSLWIPGLKTEDIRTLSQASEVVRDLLEAVEPPL